MQMHVRSSEQVFFLSTSPSFDSTTRYVPASHVEHHHFLLTHTVQRLRCFQAIYVFDSNTNLFVVCVIHQNVTTSKNNWCLRGLFAIGDDDDCNLLELKASGSRCTVSQPIVFVGSLLDEQQSPTILFAMSRDNEERIARVHQLFVY